MSQFCVYSNADAASRRAIPCWLNIQSDLIDIAESRVVVPLILPERAGPLLADLMPTLTVAGKPMVMHIAQITNVPIPKLGKRMLDPSADLLAIMAAL